MAVSEEDVKKSFARVKDDLLQFKRALNKQLFSVEAISKSLGDVLQKEEFYAFIKRLGMRIEELENRFALKSDAEDVEGLASRIRKEISGIKDIVDRKDELAEEIRQVRKLQGKVLELEGISVQKPEFSKELARLKAELSSLKSTAAEIKSGVPQLSEALSKLNEEISSIKPVVSEGSRSTASMSSSLVKMKENLANLASKLNSLTAQAVVKEDIASFTGRIESSHQGLSKEFASLKRDVDKKAFFVGSFEEKLGSLSEKLAASESAISAIGESLSRKFAEKASVEKALAELKSKLNETRQLIESSVSEVNLDDYVAKRSLKQQLSSLSDSIGASVSSAVASKTGSIEEQLGSLKVQLDSVRKEVEKQLSRQQGRFADARELEKAREKIESFSSEFVSFSDFASKIDRLQKSAEEMSNDARKEVKRQKEAFDERVRSLESHYRSSNDSLKAELDELRGSIKSLSKADAAAKVEMAKISTSAAKVAAKTAVELIEEAEEDTKEGREGKEGRRGKGLSPFAVSVIIIALLVFSSISYVLLKGGEAPEAQENVTLPEQPVLQPETILPSVVSEPEPSVPPAEPAQPEPVEQPKPEQQEAEQPEVEPLPVNVSAAANVSANVSVSNESTANVTAVNVTEADLTEANVTKELTQAEKNQNCKRELECTKRSGAQNDYWFDCYFDNLGQQCRCFVGSIEKCPGIKAIELELNETAEVNMSASSGGEAVGRAVSMWYYVVVVLAVLAILFFAFKALFGKEGAGEAEKVQEKKAEKKEAKPAKAARKQEKERGKAAKEESKEEGEEDVIDLEEFFEKK